MKTTLSLIFALALSLHAEQGTPTLAATAKGVQVHSDAGTFTLVPGSLRLSEGDYSGKKPELAIEGESTVVATYQCGAELRMVVNGQQVDCSFSGVPSGAWGFVVEMVIPLNFSQGGKYSFGTSALKEFPQEKGAQLIAQSTTNQFNLVDPGGAGFTINATQAYTQLQDNRVFNWKVFAYLYNFVFSTHSGKSAFQLQFVPLDPGIAQ